MASPPLTPSPSAPSLLDVFPVEIVESVLLNLDESSIIACLDVSQTMRAIIESSLHIQYKIECYLARVVDNSSKSDPPVVERLRKVRDWHKAFVAGEWKREEKRMIILQPGLDEEEEILALGVYGPAYVVQIGLSITTVQPPSPFRGRPEERWEIEDTGFAVHAFEYDHHEQVLALAEMEDGPRFRIHLRSPTGEVHPLAASPIIHADAPHANTNHALPGFEFCMEFQSDLLLVLVGRHYSLQGRPRRDRGIFVYNWKTSEVLLNIHESRETAFQSTVSFLSSDYLLLPVDDTKAYSFTDIPGLRGGCIAVLGLHPGFPARRSVREAVEGAVLLLGIPDPMDSDTRYRRITCISKPPFAAENATHSSDIFSHRPEASLLGIQLAIIGSLDGEHAQRTVTVFVLRDAVLSYLASSLQGSDGATGYVPWSDLATCAATLTSKFKSEAFSSNFVSSRCFHALRDMTPETAVVTTHDFFSEKMYKDRKRLSRCWQSDVDLGSELSSWDGGLDNGEGIYAQSTAMEFELSCKNKALLRAGEDFLLLVYHDADNPSLSIIETYLM